MMRLLVLAGPVLLMACSRGETSPEPDPVAPVAASPAARATQPPPATTPAGTVKLALDAEGLRFVDSERGSTRLVAFGAPRGETEQAVSSALGRMPERSSLGECPAGPTDFSRFGSFQLAFQDGKWIGWSLLGASELTTMDGIGIGSSGAEIAGSRAVTLVPDSTLGREFVLGPAEQETAIAGILDDGDRVETLWAGVACNFR